MAKHKEDLMKGIFLVVAVVLGVDAASNTTTSPGPRLSPAQYVIKHEGKMCLLATFNTTIRISYEAVDEFNQTTAKTVPVSVNADAITLDSHCATKDNNMSSLVLSWALETFNLQLDFTLKKATGAENSSWALTTLIFTYDKADKKYFHDALKAEVMTVKKDNLTVFATPLGRSYLCATGDEILLGEVEKGAAILFTDIQLQPFGITSDNFDEAVICEIDEAVSQMEKENLLVPVVVAGCLAGIILIVILVYIVTRRVNKSNYKQMD